MLLIVYHFDEIGGGTQLSTKLRRKIGPDGKLLVSIISKVTKLKDKFPDATLNLLAVFPD